MLQDRNQYGENGDAQPARGHLHNVGEAERWMSVVSGGVLALIGLGRRSAGGTALGLGGGYLVYRGLTGDCFLYRSLGLNTAKRAYAVSQRQGLGVEESVIVNATPEDLYAFWRNLKNLPRFMSHLESVKDIGGGRSHWTTQGPAGTTVEWDAEIVGDVAGELLSWRSLPGAMVPNAGAVRFRAMPGGQSTIVRVSLRYNPPGGALGAAFARLFGEAPQQQIADDLDRLKTMMETGAISQSELRATGLEEGQPRVKSGTFEEDEMAAQRQNPEGDNERDADQNKVNETEADQIEADRTEIDEESDIDEALEETFPTSDPPSFSPGRAGGRTREDRDEAPDKDQNADKN